ncbi:MAG: hypothetical protein K2J04_10670, partial [Lachnospiraceae bacterium]|nr:hypothetical protein [Lachnospiraceae bacterium]
MEHIAELGGIVTGFNVTEQCIDCMCGKNLVKIDKYSWDIICQKTIFEKEGLSRKLTADDEQIFIYDFCTLYVLNQKNYELIGKWQLGNDLSSDICGMAVDNDTIYCSIRNGKIITLDRKSYLIKEFIVSESSMWSIKIYDSYLVCGTVDGKLLLLDKSNLSIEKELVLGKKNIGSLYIDGETLYAAGHDGKLFKIRLRNFEVETSMKNVHKKMFDCAGICEDMLVTISYPCSEIALWNKDTLEKIKVINAPLKLSGRTHIENNFMYISSRNILGID